MRLDLNQFSCLLKSEVLLMDAEACLFASCKVLIIFKTSFVNTKINYFHHSFTVTLTA